jgi:hypothetical protein
MYLPTYPTSVAQLPFINSDNIVVSIDLCRALLLPPTEYHFAQCSPLLCLSLQSHTPTPQSVSQSVSVLGRTPRALTANAIIILMPSLCRLSRCLNVRTHHVHKHTHTDVRYLIAAAGHKGPGKALVFNADAMEPIQAYVHRFQTTCASVPLCCIVLYAVLLAYLNLKFKPQKKNSIPGTP